MLAVALSSSGCGISRLFGKKEASEPVIPPLPVLSSAQPVTVLWQRDLGKGGMSLGFDLKPAVFAERLIVPAGGDKLLALDRNSGDSIWEVDVDFTISAGVATDGELVAVPGAGGELAVLDFATGALRWQDKLSSQILAAPLIARGRVIARSADGSVHALADADGASLWRYDRAVPELSLRGDSPPLLVGDTVVAGLANGYLVGLSLEDGVLRWESRVAAPRGRSELERMVDIDGSPTLVDGVVFASSFQGQMAAVGGISGETLWERDFSAYGALGSDWGSVYAADADGAIWALDTRNGRAAWRQEGLVGRKLGGVATVADYVVAGDNEGYVHWLASVDGAIVARYRLAKDPIISQPLVVGDTVYAYSGDGELAALQLPSP